MNKQIDVWFCRRGDKLYMAWARPGDAPDIPAPVRVLSVASGYMQVRRKNKEVVSVGICSPDMLGFE